MIYKTSLLLLSVVLNALILTQAHSAQLVIIIDDIGNNYEQGNAMVELEGSLTLAFLPHTPYAKKLANKAYLVHKEIILHAPMENTAKAVLGPGALTQELTETELKQTLKEAIASIPHTQGINNHMGSALTQNKQSMKWVMETLQDEQLYFVDSLTSPKSVAYKLAQQQGLPSLRRHVFLDNDTSFASLNKQWQQALRISKKYGSAVLIAHPYTESHDFLAQKIPELSDQNVQLVPASQLFLDRVWKAFDHKKPHNSQYTNRYRFQSEKTSTFDSKQLNRQSDLLSNRQN
ncbi:MAG: polysaccharide deacetylase 2 family uncharacterized protein YibQ [Oleispira sp.]|jgi:polysaccharide deacetylase 2 family uncharacterized protein YibQ